MKKDGIYTVIEDSDSAASSAGQLEAIFDMLRGFDEPKKKKKSKKKKNKKRGKHGDDYLDSFKGGKKGNKKSKKKDKKPKDKNIKKTKKSEKTKSKKRAEWELKHRLIEKTFNITLDTSSDIAKMYAASKFYPEDRKRK
jgi:hypothetical protein